MGNEVSIKVKKKQEKWPIHSNKLSGIYYHRTETWEVSQLRSNPPAVHYKKETRSREQETAPQNPPQHPKLVWRQQFWSPPVWKWKRQKRTATKLQKALQPRDEVRLPCSERWHNTCLFDHTQHKIRKAKFSFCLKNKNLQASNEINMTFLVIFLVCFLICLSGGLVLFFKLKSHSITELSDFWGIFILGYKIAPKATKLTENNSRAVWDAKPPAQDICNTQVSEHILPLSSTSVWDYTDFYSKPFLQFSITSNTWETKGTSKPFIQKCFFTKIGTLFHISPKQEKDS